MSGFQDRIYNNSPHIVQNILITIFNIMAYKGRYSGKYKEFIKIYDNNKSLSLLDLKEIQKQKYRDFILHAIENSKFYRELYQEIDSPEQIENIQNLPIVDKELLRRNLDDIYTVELSKSLVSKTGGTTGKSLVVRYTHDDVQERFAILDNFRNKFGYKLGKKTAWFSGKALLTTQDIKKNRFWKTDYLYKVRYYSTFHIHQKYLKHYIEDLIKFSPEYMVGFPSTMYEIAKFGINQNIFFPSGIIKAIFPTAETVTGEIRITLEEYFKTKVYNQYASSEGAPFILECIYGKLHLELQSGVFETLDNNNNPVNKGKLVVTSFNSHGTPLIRYDIGDEIEIGKDETCPCGNHNPIVKEIFGRVSDYIFSEEMGKINLGNISNCLKGVKGIIKFQIQQNLVEEISVLIEKDQDIYNSKYEKIFMDNLKNRVGNKMQIELIYVDEIPVEKSGKFRLVKNSIKQ